MRANVAIRAGEIGGGGPPSSRVGLLARDIAWDGVSRKLPHADPCASPFDSHDAPPRRVEGRAKRRVRLLDATACVFVAVVVAVVLLRGPALLALDAHGAIARGVEGHGVPSRALVDGLHDVDFSVLRPVE